MFAGGNLHGDGGKLARYLTEAKEGERVELADLRGFATDNIQEAFAGVELEATQTEAEYPFFHGYIRAKGESLTREQWLHCIDRYEEALGFQDQPRAVSFHIDEQSGEIHPHVAWSRINIENEKYFAIDPGLYILKGIEVAREVKLELGLAKVGSERNPDHKTQSPKRDELEESRRLGTDLRQVRE